MPNAHFDRELLEAALMGFRQQQSIIEAKIAEIRHQLSYKTDGSAVAFARDAPKPGRRPLSAAARKRIAAAQRKRWAAFRQAAKK